MHALTTGTDTLSSFQVNPLPVLERIKESGEPIVLTMDGKPKCVVQDAASYQRLVDVAERVSLFECVQRSLEQVKHGQTRPIREVLEELRLKYET